MLPTTTKRGSFPLIWTLSISPRLLYSSEKAYFSLRVRIKKYPCGCHVTTPNGFLEKHVLTMSSSYISLLFLSVCPENSPTVSGITWYVVVLWSLMAHTINVVPSSHTTRQPSTHSPAYLLSGVHLPLYLCSLIVVTVLLFLPFVVLNIDIGTAEPIRRVIPDSLDFVVEVFLAVEVVGVRDCNLNFHFLVFYRV